MLRRASCIYLGVLVCALLMSSGQALGHGVVIARNAAGKLQGAIHVPMPVELPPSIFPGITGHADPEPGLTSIEVEEPDEDLFFLDPGSNIHFVFIGADPGLQIVTSHVWVPGEDSDFGPPFFDEHLIFNIPNGVIGQEYALQFRLYDSNGVHSDSDIVTLRFTPVAEACACRGDTNADDARDGADVRQFLTCFIETPPGDPPDSDCRCADVDGDGAMDETDLTLFVTRLLESSSCH